MLSPSVQPCMMELLHMLLGALHTGEVTLLLTYSGRHCRSVLQTDLPGLQMMHDLSIIHGHA